MGSMAVISRVSFSVPVSIIQCTAPLLRFTFAMGYIFFVQQAVDALAGGTAVRRTLA